MQKQLKLESLARKKKLEFSLADQSFSITKNHASASVANAGTVFYHEMGTSGNAQFDVGCATN